MEGLEFFPPTMAKSRAKSGKTSKAYMKEFRLRIPDLTKVVQEKEQLSFEHIALGDWLIWRDLLRYLPPGLAAPRLLCPQVAHQFVNFHTQEVLLQAQQIIQGLWKQHAVVGVPICDGGHWTLLVFRLSGGKDFAEIKDMVKVVYYDSSNIMSDKCWDTANKFVDFRAPGVPFPRYRFNRTFQDDGISCGQFLLHYWEGEVRQFAGQGWCVGRPFKSVVTKIRTRLMGISRELEEFIKKPFAASKKEEVGEAPAAGLALPASEDMKEFLAAQANTSLSVGLVPFYGCSKCRYSRSGCIWWKCNPEKFMAHLAMFPDKYIGKDIAADTWSTVSEKELEGDI